MSSLGFGAYRVDSRTPEHRESLEMALRAGCNLIDTSTNYTDGESEICIGATLEEGFHQASLRREAIVVVSKIGYVQGRNLALAREREAAGNPFPDMVKVSPGCWHCIHPRFLEDQLTRSLERLRLQTLDVCLLHNPEYFLEGAHRQGEQAEPAKEEFYRRIQDAFQWLEREVRRGRIAWYGVSSNSFGGDPEEADSTSLGRMLDAARRAASGSGLHEEEHHFAVAQLPLNLYEHAPATRRKEGEAGKLTTLELATESSVGVLVNRPLNAFHQGGMVRLADFRAPAPGVSVSEALARVSLLEEEFDREVGSRLRSKEGTRPTLLFDWGRQLADAVGRLGGWEHWQAIEEQQINPSLYHAVASLRASLPAEVGRGFESWLQRYLPPLGDLLAVFRADCAARSQARSDEIAERLDPALPDPIRQESLSRKAQHVIASLPGVTCVLNGMRRPAYVEDSLEILKWDPLPDASRIFSLLE